MGAGAGSIAVGAGKERHMLPPARKQDVHRGRALVSDVEVRPVYYRNGSQASAHCSQCLVLQSMLLI